MTINRTALAGILLAVAYLLPSAVAAQSLALFTTITYSPQDNSPPPPDALAVFDATIDVTGLAYAPDTVTISIPRPQGNFSTSVQLEHMDRREGYFDGVAIPGLPPEQFSYTWSGRGNGYDLRLTVHRGDALGVLSGAVGRFGIGWSQVKEINMNYYRPDFICAHNFDDNASCIYDDF